MDLEIFFIF